MFVGCRWCYEEGAKDAKETVCQRLQAVCVMKVIIIFLNREMHANTKQNIYFSQAQQIEKYAM